VTDQPKDSILKETFGSEVADDEGAQLQHFSKELINRFYMLYRTAKVHDLENQATVKAIENFRACLEEGFKIDTVWTLAAVGDTFYLNKSFVKVDFRVFENVRFLLQTFTALNVGAIEFLELPSKESLEKFITAMIKSELDPDEPGWVGNQQMPGFKIEKAKRVLETVAKPVEKVDLKDHEILLKFYCKAILGVRSVLDKVNRNEVFQISRLQQVAHDLIDAINAQQDKAVALIWVDGEEEQLATHLVNTMVLSLYLGFSLELKRKQLSELCMAALFHGIGKLLVPEELIKKTAALTKEDTKVFERSNVLSIQLLLRGRGLNESVLRRVLVAFEHARGVEKASSKGEGLSLFSRIVSITSAFEAMITPKEYRDALMPDEAMKLLLHDKAQKFDQKLSQLFIATIKPFPVGSFVLLSSNESGIVVENCQDQKFPNRPKLKCVFDVAGNSADGEVIDLMERNAQGNFARTIVHALDPHKFNINPLHFVFS
jgi:HD-GYP domain-containing protein (c-di-GMP phosphodiesterase class II)